jgi:CubicO group peptidase (beta-lactamase class C family)
MPTRRDFLAYGSAAAAVSPITYSSVAAASPSSNARIDTEEGHYSRSLVQKLAITGVTGASFAYWDGARLHTAVAGLRNSVTRDPVTSDTVMHVGSITKVMNATLVMQLVDEGKINLEDPVLKHLPELRVRDMQALQRMTCAMLLNHTSGIDGEWLPEFGPDRERIVDAIERCADLGQLFPPGEETSYCNIAPVIAGYMVQKLRGKSWYTLVKERIYMPLGMQHALVDTLEVPRFRVSIGDVTDAQSGKLIQTTRPFLAPSFAPSGSTQMTTATDLVTFARALIGGGVGPNSCRILSESSAQRMMRPTAEFVAVGGPTTKVGLGWMIETGDVLEHGGSGPGVHSQLYAHPASGRVMALLTNCDTGERLQKVFSDPIADSWTGTKPPAPMHRISPVALEPYIGVYETNADQYTVSAAHGMLELRIRDKIDTYDNSTDEHGPAAMLYPVGDDTFEGKDPAPGGSDIAIRFVRPGSDGRMRFLASWDRLLARTQ